MKFTHRTTQLTTQFMLMCWGASVVSLLPLPWAQLRATTQQSLKALEPLWLEVTASYVVTEPVLTESQTSPPFSAATVPMVFNRLEVSWAEVWKNSLDAAASSWLGQTPAQILAQNQEALAQQPELIVDLSDRKLYVYQGKTLQKTYPIAIGQTGWETPKGIFQVMDKQKDPAWKHPITGKVIPPGEENPLGNAWVGFWYNEGYHIGFHGTAQEQEMGQAISHGCVRLLNDDILELYDRVEVGWIVTVRA
ncbi:MAG: L,D-transpeptidase [Prochlorotrichaceae cyanobacterium]